MDTTPTFQPNMRKSNVALSCSLKTPEFDEKFAPEYSRRKHHFYCANTTDSHQDKSESFQLLPMQGGACQVGRHGQRALACGLVRA